jgi:protocatechuate 3,4-dioxygenase alpha subunit
MRLPHTPSQTVGPYLSIALHGAHWPFVVPEGTPGAFWLRGRVLDGAGEAIPDALVETWQADPDGRFDHPDDPRGAVPPELPGFRGFGRSETLDGEYAIHTVRPGRVPDGAGGLQAPHLDVTILARGLLDRLVTRLYFADVAAGNAEDPVLAAVDPALRERLVATPSDDGYRLDLVLQGDRETVFFRV